MIKVALAGADGRMGQQIRHILEADPKAEVVATLIRQQPTLDPNHKIDVMIDFSTLQAVPLHIQLCQKQSIPLVLGVTGLTEQEIESLKLASRDIPIVYAPNMSIGMNICFKLLEMMGKNSDALATDIAIHEIHHKLKKDAPSGTAIKMREVITKAQEKSDNKVIEQSRGVEIPISSLRVGEVPGEHTVVFALKGEQIEITHKALNRSIFAGGAVQAAKWIIGKKPGLYDMQDVLGLKNPTAL